MIQLKILSGKKAGTEQVVRRFPFLIGRESREGLVLDDEGVWESHATINLEPAKGFRIESRPEALVAVNGEKVHEAGLGNGDLLEIGSVKLAFSLSAPAAKSLRFREVMTWVALAGLTAAQMVLMYSLLD